MSLPGPLGPMAQVSPETRHRSPKPRRTRRPRQQHRARRASHACLRASSRCDSSGFATPLLPAGTNDAGSLPFPRRDPSSGPVLSVALAHHGHGASDSVRALPRRLRADDLWAKLRVCPFRRQLLTVQISIFPGEPVHAVVSFDDRPSGCAHATPQICIADGPMHR